MPRFVFAAPKPRLGWDANQGIVERLGPQMVPLRGRGYDRADIRIHRDRPAGPRLLAVPAAGVDDPGRRRAAAARQRAGALDGRGGRRQRDAIAARIKALGSPAVSELVPLPIRRGGVAAKFGLDLKPLLAKIAGANQPGAYLVGLRPVDGADRRWLRVQVTDLTLSDGRGSRTASASP